jgi:hypothetical protein
VLFAEGYGGHEFEGCGLEQGADVDRSSGLQLVDYCGNMVVDICEEVSESLLEISNGFALQRHEDIPVPDAALSQKTRCRS